MVKFAPDMPTSSPYSGEMISLRFGPTSRNYHVPIQLIEDFNWAPESVKGSRKSWFGHGSISMPDIAENIGHVLVHYLHTGTYQVLCEDEEKCTDSCMYDLKVALEVLFAAEKCEMAGLQDLAKSKISIITESLETLNVVHGVDSILQKQEKTRMSMSRVWLYEFILSRIRVDLEINSSVLDCILLINIIYDKRFLKYLAIRIFEIIDSRTYLSEGKNFETSSKTYSPLIFTPTSEQSDFE